MRRSLASACDWQPDQTGMALWRRVVLWALPGGLLLMASATMAAQDPVGGAAGLTRQALRYVHGEGVAPDPGRGIAQLCRAARSGYAPAAFDLGWLYLNGHGIPADEGLALAWLGEAERLGEKTASSVLRRLPRTTIGMPVCAGAPKVAMVQPAATVEAIVRAWAGAWSRQDAEEYLSFYSRDFSPPPGLSRETWRRLRRERVLAPDQIELKVSRLIVDPMAPSWVFATFVQDYRASHYRDRVVKTLEFKMEADGWRIVAEHSR